MYIADEDNLSTKKKKSWLISQITKFCEFLFQLVMEQISFGLLSLSLSAMTGTEKVCGFRDLFIQRERSKGRRG